MTSLTIHEAHHRAVVVTALRVEYNAVRAHLTGISEDEHPEGDVYERGLFNAGERLWDVGIVEMSMGNPNAAQKTERAISHFKPEVVLFVGVAGGIKDVAIGDVVVATKVYGYHSGKSDNEFKTRPEVGLPHHRILERARAESRKQDWSIRLNTVSKPVPKVFLGAIAAGEQVVTSENSESYRLIRNAYNDALAVEMESYGFLKAVQTRSGVEALVVRGISDLLEGKTEADHGGSQERASQYAAAFAFEVLAKLSVPDKIIQTNISEVSHEISTDRSTHTHSTLPIQPFFFGRVEELRKIYDALRPERQGWGIMIAGPGGIGKTALAIHAAEQAPEELFEQKIFISAKIRELTPSGEVCLTDFVKPTFAGMLTELAKYVGGDGIVIGSNTDITTDLRDMLMNKKVLIIFDNLETLLLSERERIYLFLNRLPKYNKAIVTCRRWPVNFGVNIMPLSYLSHDDSIQILLEYKKTHHRLQKVKIESLYELCKITNGNPCLINWIAGQLGNENSGCYKLDDAYQLLRKNPENDPLEYVFGDLLDNMTDKELAVLDALSWFEKPAELTWISEMTQISVNELELIFYDLTKRSIVIPNNEATLFTLPALAKDYIKLKGMQNTMGDKS